ncbi:MAG: hypothetical protein ABSF69_13290 [Polyangiaceae bacterium]
MDLRIVASVRRSVRAAHGRRPACPIQGRAGATFDTGWLIAFVSALGHRVEELVCAVRQVNAGVDNFSRGATFAQSEAVAHGLLRLKLFE